jgi:hypothetical protein
MSGPPATAKPEPPDERRGGSASATNRHASADRVAAIPLEGSGAPFSRTALWVIAGLVVASLATVVALTLLAEDNLQAEPSNGADGYSASAIGHRGAIKLLRNLDIPVVVSQSNSAAKAKGGLLVIAEPLVTDETSADRFIAMVHSAERVLVVLPKWWTTPSSSHKEWANDVNLVPTEDVAAVLEKLSLDEAMVARADEPIAPVAVPGDPLPGMLPEVTIQHAAQTLDGGYFEDSLAADPGGTAGTLVGWTTVGDTRVTVLTDPDVMNNHGLDEGKNARFLVGLVDKLRNGGPVVFDEIAHGYTLEPSIWKLMFQWPLVLATLQALICILVIVAATAGRFGPPARTERPYAAGKDFLIRNTAALLRYGGHDAEALYRYFTVTVQQVRAVLHAPRDLNPEQLSKWLERIRVARRGTIALPELEQWVEAASSDPALARRIPEVAMRIHRWRQEMTRGSDEHP